MFLSIDSILTGKMIKLCMSMRHLSVNDVKEALSLDCPQSVYHWLNGQSLPTTDNLYALSNLLRVPMDMLVVGRGKNHAKLGLPGRDQRLILYYELCSNKMYLL